MEAIIERPALRYHGGKFRLAEHLIRHMPEHTTYVCGFGGGGSDLLRKWRSKVEVYNDLDQEIVSYFQVLRDPVQAQELARLLGLTPYSRVEFERAYEPTSDPVERARRTLIRSHMGFGSDSCNTKRRTGFRTSRSTSGDGGTPPSLDWSRLPAHVPSFTARFAGVIIENRDALEVAREFDGPETLHYFDPPYVAITRSEARGYRHELTDGDHVRLADGTRGLAGMVLVSGYRCDLYDELYHGWHRVDRHVRVFRGSKRTESLWLNAKAIAALQEEGRSI